MNIRCGNCQERHGNVPEVRECYREAEESIAAQSDALEAERLAELTFEE